MLGTGMAVLPRATATSTRCWPGSAGEIIAGPARYRDSAPDQHAGFVPHAESLARDGASPAPPRPDAVEYRSRRARAVDCPTRSKRCRSACKLGRHAGLLVRRPVRNRMRGTPHVARANPATKKMRRGVRACAGAEAGRQARRGEAEPGRVLAARLSGVHREGLLTWIGEVEASTPSMRDRREGRDRLRHRGRPGVRRRTAARRSPRRHRARHQSGQAHLRFEHPGSASGAEVVVVREGEKAREIRVQFGDGAGSAAPDSPPPGAEAGVAARGPATSRTLAYVLGGVGIASAGVGVVFWARQRAPRTTPRAAANPTAPMPR